MAVNQRKVYINEDINSESIFKCIYYLNKIISMDKIQNKKNDIEIIINTNGGYLYDCFTLISYIEQLKEDGYKIITTNMGRAFSAGFLISICGSERRAYRYARYMYHELSSCISGTYHEMKESLAESTALMDMIKDLIKKYTNIEEDFINDINIRKEDKYFSPKELKDMGGVDIIL